MIDLMYVVVTVAFFGLMLMYVAACDRIGRTADGERGQESGQ
jgi:hypothetical protein